MIMKKLIAIAVVFALVAGGVFAADLGVNVIGSVDLFQGNNVEGEGVGGGLSMNRARIQGAGENDDGTFGAWMRFEAEGGSNMKQGVSALAWWKPIDMFKLSIGGNPDGLYDKQGYSGWMFHQIVADTNVVNASQAWGCAYTINGPPWTWGGDDKRLIEEAFVGGAPVFQNAFYGGEGGNALFLEIKPVDMFGINVILPYEKGGTYFDEDNDEFAGGVAEVFKNMTVQLDVNLDFGNIALTIDLDTDNVDPDKIGATAYLYLGLTSIDNLSLDAGIGMRFPETDLDDNKITYPLAIGVAAKYDVNDQFGLKARAMARFLGGVKPDAVDKKVTEPFALIFDIQPYYAINDSVTIFADIGINMVGSQKYDGEKLSDAGFGWHLNPYIGVGQEWGPRFFAGFKIWSTPVWAGAKDDGVIKLADKASMQWSVPIGLVVSF
jgi:hypothetical protein